jgi:hypothetical protein
MSQNVWATIMPFGPVTNFLLAQKTISFQALIKGIKFYPYKTSHQWWVSGNYNTSLGIGSEPNSEVLGLWAEINDLI